MIIIENINDTTFKLNNIKNVKNFVVIKQGDNHLSIHNVFDTRFELVPTTHHSQFRVNGVVYTSQSDLIDILAPLLYSKITNVIPDYITGPQGPQGPSGLNGQTSYIHLAYANSIDGSIDFSVDDSDDKAFIGVYTDFNLADSNNYAVYTWSLIKGQDGINGVDGKDGINGVNGTQGPAGVNGQTTYVHIAYANSANGMLDFSTSNSVNKEFIGTLTDYSLEDSINPALYTWSLIKGQDGANGIAGANGVDGKSTYIHFAYANNSTGTSSFSTTDGAGKSYVGIYTDNNLSDSTNPALYTWSLIKGADGAKGIDGLNGTNGADGTQGPAGVNGQTTYVHIAYATNSTGTAGFSVSDATNKTYIGTLTDFVIADSTNPALYTWSLIKGQDGANGIQGPAGANGQASYIHFAYANSANGATNFSTTDGVNKSYIGVYTDFTLADSNIPSLYTWSLIKGTNGIDGTNGTNGANGTPGAAGANGQTSYVHIAYATNSTGTSGFSVSDPVNKTYIGTLTDFVIADSTNPTLYTWSLIKGQDGANGIQGPAGANGVSTYIHFAYANSANGATNFSTTDGNGRAYIGVYTDSILADSNNYALYTWSLIKGADGANGANGIQGPAGANGVSTYIHFAYANSANGASSFSTTDPTGRAYIGVYTDTLLADSNNYAVYTWSLVKGTDGANGIQGPQGNTGAAGATGSQGPQGNTGAAGANGTNGVDAKKSTTGYVYYQASQSTSPATPSASSYTFSNFSVNGLTGGWSQTPPTATGSGKYWVSVFNSTETTANGNSGSVSFTTPTSSFSFTDLVTFTNLASAGQTVIDGGNLTTGLIKSSNFTTGTAPYAAAGTRINLNNGTIESKNFALDAGGNSFFNGAINGGTIDIGGADTTSFHVDASGQMWIGAAAYASSPFKVSSTGNLFLDGTGSIRLGSNGSIYADNGYTNMNFSAFQCNQGQTDNTGNGNNLTAGRIRFDGTNGNTEAYSYRTIQSNYTLSYEMINKSQGSYSWNANNGFTNRMTFGVTGGDLTCTGNITAYYSDNRLKTNLGNIENPLDKINSLNGFVYVNNDVAKSFGYDDDKLQVGVSAQEVQSVMPEVIAKAPFDTDSNGESISGNNYLTVQYDRLVPLLIEGIKELNEIVNQLKNEIKELKEK